MARASWLEHMGRLSINSSWENLHTAQAFCAARKPWHGLDLYSKVPLYYSLANKLINYIHKQNKLVL